MTTCSICLSTLRNPFTRKRLSPCNHVFHKKCIRYLESVKDSKCPNCNTYIFKKSELDILSNPSSSSSFLTTIQRKLVLPNHMSKHSMQTSPPPLINHCKILKEAIRTDNDRVEKLILNSCDIGSVVVDAIVAEDEEMLRRLTENAHMLNWYATFNGGDTFLDVALRTKNEYIINLVLDKTGFSIYPSAPSFDNLNIS